MLAIHYKVFFEVASYLSFTKAAEVLYISQPAVSKQIKKLEAELSIALFERSGNTIKLTPSGEKLLQYLHKVRLIEKQMQSDVDIVKEQIEVRGELKIGASTTVSLYVMPRILSSYRKKFPQVRILLINRNSENVLRALINKEIDLAIIEEHHKINAVHFQPFIKDEIIAVCAKHSPYGIGEVSLRELKEIPIALRERGSGTQSVLSKQLEKSGIRLNELSISARLGGTEALKNFLIQDDSIGFLSRMAVDKELSSGILREVKIKSFKVNRKFNFVMRKGEESVGIIKSIIKEALHYNY